MVPQKEVFYIRSNIFGLHMKASIDRIYHQLQPRAFSLMPLIASPPVMSTFVCDDKVADIYGLSSGQQGPSLVL